MLYKYEKNKVGTPTQNIYCWDIRDFECQDS